LQQIPAKVIVGVDFGTTFSGFTFAILGGRGDVIEAYDYPSAIIHPRYPKVPTEILYDKSVPPKPIYWGWEAFDHKNENPEGFGKLFKLSLAPASMQAQPVVVLPTGVSARRCIVDFLRMMKEFILDTLQKHLPEMPRVKILQQIVWCLTVPAIWEERSKNEMKTGASHISVCLTHPRDSG
jgi:hypothetical protein